MFDIIRNYIIAITLSKAADCFHATIPMNNKAGFKIETRIRGNTSEIDKIFTITRALYAGANARLWGA